MRWWRCSRSSPRHGARRFSTRIATSTRSATTTCAVSSRPSTPRPTWTSAVREEVIDDARRAARTMLRRFGVQAAAHVRIEAWAQSFGIELVEAPLDGASAQLVRLKDRVQIILPERVTDVGTRRFSIAHEL